MTTSDELIQGILNPQLSAAARVQRIPVPVASPGNCILCGKSEHPEGFADARLDFEFYGTFYLCADCVGDFARLFGWLHPGQARGLALKYREVAEELATHREALLLLEQSVDGLTQYRMLRNTITGSDTSDGVDSDVTEPTSEATQPASASVIEFPGSDSTPESNVSESATEQGSNDVPEPTGDESSTVTILEL